MAVCLGHRFGTGCQHKTRSTQKTDNWELWQLCYECAVKLHPEYYAGKKTHGVRETSETRIARKVMKESKSWKN